MKVVLTGGAGFIGSVLLNELQNSKFDIYNKLVLEEKPSFEAVPGLMKAVTIKNYGPNKVVISADTAADSLLTLSDLSYPGRLAYVDGVKVKILTTDYIFRSVELTAGTHEVVFEYQPIRFYTLAIVSLFAINASGLYLFWVNRKR